MHKHTHTQNTVAATPLIILTHRGLQCLKHTQEQTLNITEVSACKTTSTINNNSINRSRNQWAHKELTALKVRVPGVHNNIINMGPLCKSYCINGWGIEAVYMPIEGVFSVKLFILSTPFLLCIFAGLYARTRNTWESNFCERKFWLRGTVLREIASYPVSIRHRTILTFWLQF